MVLRHQVQKLSVMEQGRRIPRRTEVPTQITTSKQPLSEMARYCQSCDRYFGSQHALQQHLNSPAHIFECDECDRSFGSQQALNQHLNSPARAQVYECDDCDRSFSSQQSLNQHLNSPAHALVYECDDCARPLAASSQCLFIPDFQRFFRVLDRMTFPQNTHKSFLKESCSVSRDFKFVEETVEFTGWIRT
jgi:hypothetical protein